MHVPLEQVPKPQSLPSATQLFEPGSQQPVVQAAPGQQGWPGPPQTWQMPAEPQTRPEPHASSAQQGSPAMPQDAQVPPAQVLEGAVQMPPAQQDSPTAPQPPQLPSAHVPALGQVEPEPTHVPA